jgi:threonine aldolase
MARAVRHRKVFGGGMRQSGVLAAAALYALDHHVARLADDHANARRLAAGIARIDGLRLEPETIDTNMLFFRVDPALAAPGEFIARLKDRGVLMLTTEAGLIRAVTHLDVTASDVDRALQAIEEATR